MMNILLKNTMRGGNLETPPDGKDEKKVNKQSFQGGSGGTLNERRVCSLAFKRQFEVLMQLQENGSLDEGFFL